MPKASRLFLLLPYSERKLAYELLLSWTYLDRVYGVKIGKGRKHSDDVLKRIIRKTENECFEPTEIMHSFYILIMDEKVLVLCEK